MHEGAAELRSSRMACLLQLQYSRRLCFRQCCTPALALQSWAGCAAVPRRVGCRYGMTQRDRQQDHIPCTSKTPPAHLAVDQSQSSHQAPQRRDLVRQRAKCKAPAAVLAIDGCQLQPAQCGAHAVEGHRRHRRDPPPRCVNVLRSGYRVDRKKHGSTHEARRMRRLACRVILT